MTNRYGAQSLYIYTVLVHIYRLRHKGIRQGVDELLQLPPVLGWLAYNRPHPFGMPGSHAQLLDKAGGEIEIIPELRFAKIGRIEGGMLLTGMEENRNQRPSQFPQTWAAAPSEAAAADLVRALRRKQDVIAAIHAAQQK